MAAFDTTRTYGAGQTFGGRVVSFFGNSIANIASWNDQRVTRNALAKLSDRELDDIGLVRGDIDELAGSAR